MVKIKVWQPIRYDDDIVAAAIGDKPLPIRSGDEPLSPFITIDGRIHAITSNYLRHRTLSRPNSATARRDASDLAGWLEHLIARRNRPPFEDSRDPVLQATEDDFAAYYRLRQYGAAEDVLTPDGWRHAASTNTNTPHPFASSRWDGPASGRERPSPATGPADATPAPPAPHSHQSSPTFS